MKGTIRRACGIALGGALAWLGLLAAPAAGQGKPEG